MALPFFNAYRGSIGRFFQGDPTLVGYWQLGGNSLDNSGNGNNGTNTAVSYSPAYSRFNGGQGASFNGSSSVITISNATSLQITGALSISFWIYPNVNNVEQTIIAKGPNAIGGAEYLVLLGADNGNGDIRFVSSNSSNWFGVHNANSSDNLATGQWYHIVVVRTGNTSSDTLRIYKNGKSLPVSVESTNPSYVSATSYNVVFGNNSSGVNEWFNGYLDEVGIWNRALTPQEISQYYQWATSQPRKTYYEVRGLLVPNTRRRLLLSM